jgi:hypothetical protein
VCLVVAHGLRWQPVESSLLPGQPTDSVVRQVQTLRPFFVFPIIFAGAAGYFICFWPGAHPVRRILALIFLPTLASLGLLVGLFVHLNEPFSSVLESTGSTVSHRITEVQGMLWNLPQAFQSSLIGLLLIAIFTSRMAFGIATLPLALPQRHGMPSKDFGSWRRLQMLLWFLIGFTFFVPILLSIVTIAVPFLHISRLPSYVQNAWFWTAAPIAEVVIAFGITLCIMGSEARQTVRSSIRLPTLRWSLLALAFPACIDLLISTGQYAVDRAIGRPMILADLSHHNSDRTLVFLIFDFFFFFLLHFSRKSFFAASYNRDSFIDTGYIGEYSSSVSCGQLLIFTRIFLFRTSRMQTYFSSWDRAYSWA